MNWTAAVRHLQISPALVFLLGTRAWQLAAYPLTALMIATFLTPEQQGFYYTFASLLGLQVVVELGLTIVVTNAASHEWARLALDEKGRIGGDAVALSRLVSLGRFVFLWYAVAGTLFVIGVGGAGWFFFLHGPQTQVLWRSPWIALAVTSGLLLFLLPFNALLEGCNQVLAVNRLRLNQAFLESTSLWGVLWLGGGLWAVPVAVATKLARDLYLVLVQFRHFFAPFVHVPSSDRVDWRLEIWPMQWRLAVAGLVTFLFSSIMSPIMFWYRGPVVAGQMGMTMQMVVGLQAVGMAWVSVGTPRFGMLIAQRRYGELDSLWRKTLMASTFVVVAGASSGLAAVWLLQRFHVKLAERMLSPLPTALLLLSAVLVHVSSCQIAYLRAHKREAVLAPNVSMGILNGLLVWQLGRRFGPLGAASACLIQTLIGTIWVTAIWTRCRAAWHRDAGV